MGFAALFQHLFENSDVQRFERLQKKKKKKKLAARVGDAKVERGGDSSSASKAKLADVKKFLLPNGNVNFSCRATRRSAVSSQPDVYSENNGQEMDEHKITQLQCCDWKVGKNESNHSTAGKRGDGKCRQSYYSASVARPFYSRRRKSDTWCRRPRLVHKFNRPDLGLGFPAYGRGLTQEQWIFAVCGKGRQGFYSLFNRRIREA